MQTRLLYLLLLAVSLFVVQCRKEKTPAGPETDAALFAKAQSLNGFAYYQDNSQIHRSSPQSAHKAFFRVRFNVIAQAALTDSGKLPQGGVFPAGSLIVKELQNDSLGTQPAGFAVMEKLPGDINQQQGWVWAEYKLNGSGYVISEKGAICTGCHSNNGRDDVRVFNLFP